MRFLTRFFLFFRYPLSSSTSSTHSIPKTLHNNNNSSSTTEQQQALLEQVYSQNARYLMAGAAAANPSSAHSTANNPNLNLLQLIQAASQQQQQQRSDVMAAASNHHSQNNLIAYLASVASAAGQHNAAAAGGLSIPQQASLMLNSHHHHKNSSPDPQQQKEDAVEQNHHHSDSGGSRLTSPKDQQRSRETYTDSLDYAQYSERLRRLASQTKSNTPPGSQLHGSDATMGVLKNMSKGATKNDFVRRLSNVSAGAGDKSLSRRSTPVDNSPRSTNSISNGQQQQIMLASSPKLRKSAGDVDRVSNGYAAECDSLDRLPWKRRFEFCGQSFQSVSEYLKYRRKRTRNTSSKRRGVSKNCVKSPSNHYHHHHQEESRGESQYSETVYSDDEVIMTRCLMTSVQRAEDKRWFYLSYISNTSYICDRRNAIWKFYL